MRRTAGSAGARPSQPPPWPRPPSHSFCRPGGWRRRPATTARRRCVLPGGNCGPDEVLSSEGGRPGRAEPLRVRRGRRRADRQRRAWKWSGPNWPGAIRSPATTRGPASRRAVLPIDPLLAAAQGRHDKPLRRSRWRARLAGLLRTLLDQARLAPAGHGAGDRSDIYSRFIIAPQRGTTAAKHRASTWPAPAWAAWAAICAATSAVTTTNWAAAMPSRRWPSASCCMRTTRCSRTGAPSSASATRLAMGRNCRSFPWWSTSSAPATAEPLPEWPLRQGRSRHLQARAGCTAGGAVPAPGEALVPAMAASVRSGCWCAGRYASAWWRPW